MRVQIPVYTDRWMMGDRYGEVVKITKKDVYVGNEPTPRDWCEIAHVRLDKSGKTLKFVLADCTVV